MGALHILSVNVENQVKIATAGAIRPLFALLWVYKDRLMYSLLLAYCTT